MCKAHVLRFCCGHGLLMGLETCSVAPCPLIKTTGVKLPQQPYKCYNCQRKGSSPLAKPATSPLREGPSSFSSTGSLDSNLSAASGGSATTPPSPVSPLSRVESKIMAPLPGVARQPAECGELVRKMTRAESFTSLGFSFSCTSSSHYPVAHYMYLPTFLPHQDHPCPPCQLEELRMKAERNVTASAVAQFPHLTKEMLVRDGRVWEEWQKKPTLEEFVDEQQSDERQLWLHVTRKWTQDLKKLRVLVAEEDGLGLLG